MEKPKTELTFQAKEKYFHSFDLKSLTFNVENETLVIEDAEGIEKRVTCLDLSEVEIFDMFIRRKW